MERDEEGRLYIAQKEDEADKNHDENDLEATTAGRIYEKRGRFLGCMSSKINISPKVSNIFMKGTSRHTVRDITQDTSSNVFFLQQGMCYAR